MLFINMLHLAMSEVPQFYQFCIITKSSRIYCKAHFLTYLWSICRYAKFANSLTVASACLQNLGNVIITAHNESISWYIYLHICLQERSAISFLRPLAVKIGAVPILFQNVVIINMYVYEV